MKKILNIAIIIAFILPIFSTQALALDITEAPTLKSNSTTSITLEWTEVEGALGYFVYYDTTSGEESGYNEEISELVETREYTIENLEPATDYYIAITAVDLNAEESFFSPEAHFSTAGDQVEEFALEGVEATGKKELTLLFNANLLDTADTERDFVIINTITEEEVFVTSTEFEQKNANQLVLILDRDLILGDKYDFTIISILDENSRNIESGIDALTSFEVPAVFPEKQEELEDVSVVTEESEDKIVDNLNSAGTEEESRNQEIKESTKDSGVSGKILSKEEIIKSTSQTADSSDNLPQTGPEHILLVILALLLGTISFYFFSRKKQS